MTARLPFVKWDWVRLTLAIGGYQVWPVDMQDPLYKDSHIGVHGHDRSEQAARAALQEVQDQACLAAECDAQFDDDEKDLQDWSRPKGHKLWKIGTHTSEMTLDIYARRS